jgi:hypothetical protein
MKRQLSATVTWALCLAAVLAACEDRKRAEVLIGVATDLDAPVPLQRVKLLVHRQDRDTKEYVPVDPEVTREWDISGKVMERYELPNSYVGYSDPEDNAKIMLTLVGMGSAAGGSQGFVLRKAILRLVPERTIFVRLPLTSRCVDNADCSEADTCREGRCVNPEITNSELLPTYDPRVQPDLKPQCDSGTIFRNTSTREELGVRGARCANPADVCIEGACYNPKAFGEDAPMPTGLPLTVMAQVIGADGAPITDAQLRIEEGANTMLQRLRATRDELRPRDVAPQMVMAMDGLPGRFRITTEVPSNTSELQLTATAPGHAPQVVNIPIKPGITQYVSSIVLFGVREQVVTPGQMIDLQPPGTPAQVAANADMARIQLRLRVLPSGTGDRAQQPVRLRYALIDPAHAPGRTVLSESREFVQTLGVVYVEVLDQAAPTMVIDTKDLTVESIDGASATATAYRLDLQGAWREQKLPVQAVAGAPNQITINSNGFWSVSKVTPRPGCVRGRAVRPDGSACAGVRVTVRGPTGATSFDATGSDGRFCAASAQREVSTILIGNSDRAVYVPKATEQINVCSPIGCKDLGDVMVSAEDCDQPPMSRASTVQRGSSCTRSLECGGGLTCFDRYCVTESFARVTMTWTGSTDYDLGVVAPGPEGHRPRIDQEKRDVQNIGRLDVEQCTGGCEAGEHLESVSLISSAPSGDYQVVVTNFSGGPAGEVRLRAFIKSEKVLDETVPVPAGRLAASQPVLVNLPGSDAR